jgi:hypothetical protein
LGFLRLGELYAQTNQRCFYPVASPKPAWLRWETDCIQPAHDAVGTLQMVNLLEDTIKAMHIETTENQAVESIFFRRKIS